MRKKKKLKEWHILDHPWRAGSIAALVTLLLMYAGMTAIVDTLQRKMPPLSCAEVDESCIPLGGVESPAYGDIGTLTGPGLFGRIKTVPRVWKVRAECQSLRLPRNATGLIAMTEFPKPELIVIYVPRLAGDRVAVCGPEGATIKVVLWATTR